MATKETTTEAPPREKLIKLADVPTAVPWLPTGRRGNPISVFTLIKWAQNGLRGKRLRTVYVGNKLCTTDSWLWEFFEALQTGGQHEPTPRQQQKNYERATAALAAAGI